MLKIIIWLVNPKRSWYKNVSERQELPGFGVTWGIDKNVDKHL